MINYCKGFFLCVFKKIFTNPAISVKFKVTLFLFGVKPIPVQGYKGKSHERKFCEYTYEKFTYSWILILMVIVQCFDDVVKKLRIEMKEWKWIIKRKCVGLPSTVQKQSESCGDRAAEVAKWL